MLFYKGNLCIQDSKKPSVPSAFAAIIRDVKDDVAGQNREGPRKIKGNRVKLTKIKIICKCLT